MALMILPGTSVRLDPEQITKIDICCADDLRAEVRIFVDGEATHHEFQFMDKSAAIDFYRKVWQLRSGERLEDREIESVMVRNGPELT